MKTDLVVSGCLIHNNRMLLVHHKKLDLWLPPGGHIDKDETPDEALKRETMEELNLEIKILNRTCTPVRGNTKKHLAVPFYANVHSVGDHDHSCSYYLCKPKNMDKLKINKSELKGFRWFSPKELEQKHVPADIRDIAMKAFDLFNSLRINFKYRK